MQLMSGLCNQGKRDIQNPCIIEPKPQSVEFGFRDPTNSHQTMDITSWMPQNGRLTYRNSGPAEQDSPPEFTSGSVRMSGKTGSKAAKKHAKASSVKRARPTPKRGIAKNFSDVSWYQTLIRSQDLSDLADPDQICSVLSQKRVISGVTPQIETRVFSEQFFAPQGDWGLLVLLQDQPWACLLTPDPGNRRLLSKLRKSGLGVLTTGFDETSLTTTFQYDVGGSTKIRYHSWPESEDDEFESDELPADWIHEYSSAEEVADALARHCHAYVPLLWLEVEDDLVTLRASDGRKLTAADVRRIDLLAFGKVSVRSVNQHKAVQHTLRAALLGHDKPAVRAAISAGADLNRKCISERFPLAWAVDQCCYDRPPDFELLQVLLDLGARLEPDGEPVLHRVCDPGMMTEDARIRILNILLSAGADVNSLGAEGFCKGRTVLEVAILKDWLKVARFLLAQKAVPETRNAFGKTVIEMLNLVIERNQQLFGTRGVSGLRKLLTEMQNDAPPPQSVQKKSRRT